jgi:hypothetical protein
MWPILLAVLLFMVVHYSLPLWLYVILLRFLHDRSNWYSCHSTGTESVLRNRMPHLGRCKCVYSIRSLNHTTSHQLFMASSNPGTLACSLHYIRCPERRVLSWWILIAFRAARGWRGNKGKVEKNTWVASEFLLFIKLIRMIKSKNLK